MRRAVGTHASVIMVLADLYDYNITNCQIFCYSLTTPTHPCKIRFTPRTLGLSLKRQDSVKWHSCLPVVPIAKWHGMLSTCSAHQAYVTRSPDSIEIICRRPDDLSWVSCAEPIYRVDSIPCYLAMVAPNKYTLFFTLVSKII